MLIDRPRLAVATAGACAFLNLYSPQAVLPELARGFGVSTAAAGGVVGVATLAVAASAPFVGLISDRFSRKLTAVVAMTLLALPTLMLALSHSMQAILFWRLAQGLLVPAVFTPIVALVGERWKPAEAADVLGLYIAGSALGGFLGRFVPAMLADTLGWRAGLAMLAPITLVAALLVAAWLPSSGRTGEAREPVRLADSLAHLRNPEIVGAAFVGFALLFSMVAVFTYINFRLVLAPFSFAASDLGLIFLVYPIGAAAAPTAGPLLRRLGRRRTMAAAGGLAALGLVATLVPSLPAVVVGLALFVIGVFVMQSTAMGFVGRAAHRAKASALGLYVCVYYLGGAVGAVLPGMMVWERAGWTGCVALVVAALIAAAALAWRTWWDEPTLEPLPVVALAPAE